MHAKQVAGRNVVGNKVQGSTHELVLAKWDDNIEAQDLACSGSTRLRALRSLKDCDGSNARRHQLHGSHESLRCAWHPLLPHGPIRSG